ncbi:thyroid hormone receptor interactor, putative [Eimeria tenella]|uniref:Thyroid hormone receptor interactor, putative n=1 Tax=Eimeria tenella TaxID=5802 RepID=U6L6K9_EIMTE|nr:thyroid hormone receptor interactor, putative [Eimeria tenella]CDJ44229.1 thyroid hormone receptor interactor, putative [Eimeria tenella]|eukprot:XP_013234978.1 thyroid hormone receptor interactor, putative [Eimeria tenella]
MEFPTPIAASRASTAASSVRDIPCTKVPKVDFCCEISCKISAKEHFSKIIDAANCWLGSSGLTVALGGHDPQRVGVPLLARCCRSIRIEPLKPRCSPLLLPAASGGGGGPFSAAFASSSSSSSSSSTEAAPLLFPYCQARFAVLPYLLHEGPLQGGPLDLGSEEESGKVFQQWLLPNEDFEGLWANLHFSQNTKDTLLDYASTALLFADKSVDSKLITWNRVLLLHGPPGSGKTSLCKALGQRLAIRLSRNFGSFLFVSLNSSFLFSRWFGESGKVVVRVFELLLQRMQQQSSFLFVLIDEVESLAAARAAAAKTPEPSDAARAVNALLTQMDLFSRSPNGLILTTSNLAESCDPAFLDRADLKLHIPCPNSNCRFAILESCIEELIRTKLVEPGSHTRFSFPPGPEASE